MAPLWLTVLAWRVPRPGRARRGLAGHRALPRTGRGLDLPALPAAGPPPVPEGARRAAGPAGAGAERTRPDTTASWLPLWVGMILGFATACPANVRLLRGGIKEAM